MNGSFKDLWIRLPVCVCVCVCVCVRGCVCVCACVCVCTQVNREETAKKSKRESTWTQHHSMMQKHRNKHCPWVYIHACVQCIHPHALKNKQNTEFTEYRWDTVHYCSAHPQWTFDPCCWAFRQFHICYYMILLWLIKWIQWYTLTLWLSKWGWSPHQTNKRKSKHGAQVMENDKAKQQKRRYRNWKTYRTSCSSRLKEMLLWQLAPDLCIHPALCCINLFLFYQFLW